MIFIWERREWRQTQAERIRKRDEESEAKREEIIRKAERSIDQFYENYNATKEKNIKANKSALLCLPLTLLLIVNLENLKQPM